MGAINRGYPVLLAVVLILAAPARAQSLSNFSARMDMSPGGTYICGFAVPGTTATPVLLRAVGPSLTALGVPNPVAAPDMQVFDSNGKQMVFNYAVGVVDESVLPSGLTQADFVSEIFSSVGAFPLPGGEQLGTAFNYALFAPGTYTAKITDDSGHGGTVLFEIYLLPGLPLNLSSAPPPFPLPIPPQ